MRSIVDGLSGAPVVVLVRPVEPGNIGAVARAMLNFGLSELRLVAPVRQPWLTEDAVRMSVEARLLLDDAREFATLEEAVADLQLVLATAARERSVDRPLYSAAEGCHEAALAHQRGLRVGLVFGSERQGLRTEEVSACAHAVVQIPAQPGCSVLNLSQAVVVLAYQFAVCREAIDAAGGGGAGGQADDVEECVAVGQLQGLLAELAGSLGRR